jgi:hypothetical protein
LKHIQSYSLPLEWYSQVLQPHNTTFKTLVLNVTEFLSYIRNGKTKLSEKNVTVYLQI